MLFFFTLELSPLYGRVEKGPKTATIIAVEKWLHTMISHYNITVREKDIEPESDDRM